MGGRGVSSNVEVQKFCTYPLVSLQIGLLVVNICWNLANYCMLNGSALTIPFLEGYWNANIAKPKGFPFLEAKPLCHIRTELCPANTQYFLLL